MPAAHFLSGRHTRRLLAPRQRLMPQESEMSSFLYRIGGGAARHPWRVIGMWVVALVAVTGLAGLSGGVLSDDYTIPGTSSQRATDLLKDRFPAMSGTD